MERLERARGVLWGQAVGDALGTTAEFQDPLAIAARDGGDGWPAALVGKGPFQLRPGQVTDDTELALALARCLVREGRYDDDAVAAAYVAWCRSGPFDIGQATARAFGVRGGAAASMAAVVRAHASPDTQANGSLMRASPLAVFGHRLPRAELARLAARDSTLSHPDPVCQAACAVFVTTVADALVSGDGPGPVFDRALAFARDEPLAAPVVSTLEAARQAPPAYAREKQGWVRVALQHAFFQLGHAASFEAGLGQVVQAGGDTDTNGAITGALLGAVCGEAGIPAAWRASVLGCAPPRPAEYGCADLPALAEALVRAGG